MARVSKEEMARLAGMNYALKIAKEKGIEGLEADVKMRGAFGLPVGYDKAGLDKCVERVKLNTIDTINILSCAILHDEFGFGTKRIQQFISRFMEKTECLTEYYCTWQDYIDVLRQELGIEFTIRKNDAY